MGNSGNSKAPVAPTTEAPSPANHCVKEGYPRLAAPVKNPLDDMPPHNLEAERGILGAVLLNNDLLECLGDLTPSDFYRTAHQMGWKAILKLREEGKPADIVTLLDTLRASGELEKIDSGASYIADLTTGAVVAAVTVKHYAGIVQDRAARRKVREAFIRLSSSVQDTSVPLADTLEAFNTSIDATRPQSERLCVIEARDFIATDFPPRENILAPWLPRQGLAMVYASRGVGKTFLSLGVAYAVATGGKLFKWAAPLPRGVLFLDGEMPGATFQERLARIAASSDRDLVAPLRIVNPDMQRFGMIDLTRTKDQRDLEPHLKDVDLIVVDNLSTLCRTGKESEGESWLPVQEWALHQRALGRSVLFIHHAGKSGEQRGTSRREDVLDTVIELRHPSDYTPDKGACFEVHFRKARGLVGEDVRAFEAQLRVEGDRQEWITRTLEESTDEKVARLLGDGLTQSEIAEELGLSKGAVSKAKQRAMSKGLLDRPNLVS